ncbi:hypothetical protein [Shinella sp.]|uniref:hypothetical protein n=1 Tax=Shinella sp. TaxID=1870904 RepID=UPI003F72E4BB
MKKLFLSLCGLAALASQASAGEKDNAMRHIAQVMAITNLCSTVEMNSTAVTLVAMGNGVDLSRDGDTIRNLAREQMAPWQGKDAEAACVAGMLLYGPDGQNVPGLLDWK